MENECLFYLHSVHVMLDIMKHRPEIFTYFGKVVRQQLEVFVWLASLSVKSFEASMRQNIGENCRDKVFVRNITFHTGASRFLSRTPCARQHDSFGDGWIWLIS